MFFSSNKPHYLQMRRDQEAHHFLVSGDTGTGKSQFIKQILRYARACGDTCVVLDSKLEFIPEFYNPKLNDKILSPKDERCVYWDLRAEVTDESDAMSVMRAMYPTHPDNPQSRFWDDNACKIAAYLLTCEEKRPSCAEFAHWLSRPQEIFKRLKGSEYEHTLDLNAAPQKAGILATMNQVGLALRMMPTDYDKRERFTIREWSKDREGWLFLPNTAATREALRPLQSGWAGMSILRVMSDQEQRRRVWHVFDELDTLNTIPQLPDGMTQMRSTGNPMVLGMQNIAQLDDRYGKQSDTIFSQAYTKLILATSHGKSAKAASELVGEVEIERLRETRTKVRGKTQISFATEKVREPLVMDSQISALPDLHGYFLQRGVVVKVAIPHIDADPIAPAMIERMIPSMAGRPVEPPQDSQGPITVGPFSISTCSWDDLPAAYAAAAGLKTNPNQPAPPPSDKDKGTSRKPNAKRAVNGEQIPLTGE